MWDQHPFWVTPSDQRSEMVLAEEAASVSEDVLLTVTVFYEHVDGVSLTLGKRSPTKQPKESSAREVAWGQVAKARTWPVTVRCPSNLSTH